MVRCRAALAGLALVLAPTVVFTAPEAAAAQENGVVPRSAVEGGPPSEPTEIRLLFDSQALYIGAMFYDSDPSGILARQLERNAGLGTDDRSMWILDTFQDGRTGYFFEIHPAGLMGDGLIGGGGPNKRWDGIWEVRTQLLPDGWSAEIRIPFSTLNFDPERDSWGINFQRTIRRKSEEILWSGWRRNEGLFRPVSAGEPPGAPGDQPGRGRGGETLRGEPRKPVPDSGASHFGWANSQLRVCRTARC